MVATVLIALAFLINIAIAWSTSSSSQVPIVVMVVSIVGVIIAVWQSQSSKNGVQTQVKNLNQQLRTAVNKIEAGELDEATAGQADLADEDLVETHRSFGDLIRTVKTAISDQNDVTQAIQKELLTSQVAVQKANTHLMFADTDYNIIYINDSLNKMLQIHEQELASHFPGFNMRTLVGTNIDIFHKDPSHQRRVLSSLTTEYQSEITVGDLIFGLTINPVYSDSGERTGTVVEWTDLSDRAETEKLKHENLRISTALGAVTTNVMLADADYNIVYMNENLVGVMEQNRDKFAAAFNGFNVANLLGTNIDVFHKDPSHQRRILDVLKTTYRSEVAVQDLTFGLVINPILDEAGERLGTVVEWSDLTAFKRQQEQEQVNARMKVALDNVSTNVMLADPNYRILYLNDSLRQMMRKNADKFRTIRADFDPDALEGVNIDIFHKSPSHQRQLLDNLTQTYSTEVELEGLHLRLTANPVVNTDGERLGTTLEWEDITHIKEQAILAQENARIKVALDGVTTNVMVADRSNNIVYVNNSVLNMLRNAANDIRKDLPHFDPDALLGKNIDIFHKNPDHQRSMLARLESTYRAKITVGGRHFNLIATPVKNELGERLGTVVEWSDITAQVNIEGEVERLVQDVSDGRLGALISTDDKEGFFLNISEGLNDLSQTINAFVRDISSTVQKLSEGELTSKIDNQYKGNFGDVALSLNGTIDKLNDVLGNVKRSTDSIRSSNHEISIGNDQLSTRTEKQASNLEETAASLEQLTSNVRNTADNATTADKAANSAKQQASLGEAIVTDAVQSMAAITESSNKIVEIISVIDDIAFQTNLLALNASVEAARAGEQGRGFAVVANEVRNLAQRSAVSAKEIKELIDVSSNRVSTGSDQVNKCGEALKDILNHVDDLTMLISDIANSTNEQAAGIGQVNQAVAELDDITQQNAALAEEASSASQSSVQQADEMVDIVSFFRTTEGEGFQPAPRRTQPLERPKAAPRAPAPTMSPRPSASDYASNDDSDDDWQEF